MVETAILEQQSAEVLELPHQYPDGMMVYCFPEENRVDSLQNTLQKANPTVLTIVKADGVFPADIGTQLGGTYYGSPLGISIAEHAIYTHIGYEKLELPLFKFLNTSSAIGKAAQSILPSNTSSPHLEGGLFVFAGGTNAGSFTTRSCFGSLSDVAQSIFHELTKAYNIFTHRALSTFPALIDELKCETKERIWIEHLDLFFTAFQTKRGLVGYMDEMLLDSARKRKLTFDWFQGEVRPFPHELTRKGGLNIQYVGSSALVTSRQSIGDIGRELDDVGFNIVELGDDQFMNGGGPKCRTLTMQWARENNNS